MFISTAPVDSGHQELPADLLARGRADLTRQAGIACDFGPGAGWHHVEDGE